MDSKICAGDHIRILTVEEIQKLPEFCSLTEGALRFKDPHKILEINSGMRKHCGNIFKVHNSQYDIIFLVGIPYHWSVYYIEKLDPLAMAENKIKNEIYVAS
jgi:hypothetical protein